MKKKRIKRIRKNIKKRIQRYKCPNNPYFTFALLMLVIFLFFEVVLRSYELYKHAPVVDIPSHFLAGMALGSGVYWILSLTGAKKKLGATLLFSLAGAGIWEVLETLEDLFFVNPPYLRDPFIWDGAGDIIVGMLGVFVVLFLIDYIFHRKGSRFYVGNIKT